MMKIYRLEDRGGRGPYTSRKLMESQKRRILYPSSPGFGADTDFKGFGLRHVCGFDSISQLYEWFGKDAIAELVNLGLRICYYEVLPEGVLYGRSNRQVAFIKENAKGPFFKGV